MALQPDAEKEPLGAEALEAVRRVLESGRLTTEWCDGPFVTQFEDRFARFIGARHAVAVCTETAALHASLVASGVSRGDEIVIPSFTHVAAAEACMLAGARPVFADIDPVSYTVSPEAVEEAVTSRTAAVVASHLYGLPPDMGPIIDIAEEREIAVVEDVGCSMGAEYRGRRVGSAGHTACFSLHSTSNLSTGEGGVVVSGDEELVKAVRRFRCHGGERGAGEAQGTNYRATELQAAIGLARLPRLPRLLSKRRRNAETLTRHLAGMGGVELPREPEGRTHSWNLYTVRVSGGGRHSTRRDRVASYLLKRGVEAVVHPPAPIHLLPYYRQALGAQAGSYPSSELASRTVFSLPVHPGLDDKAMVRVAECALKALERVAR